VAKIQLSLERALRHEEILGAQGLQGKEMQEYDRAWIIDEDDGGADKP
jgi:hypothetical protein